MILLVCSFASLTLSTVENENSSVSANKNLIDSVITVSNTIADSQFQKIEADTVLDSSNVNTDINVKPKNIVNTYTGKVTWYGPGFYGRKTASGQVYDPKKYTAAKLNICIPGLKLGKTKAKITNIKTGKSIIVCINDKGSTKTKYLLDLSESAFSALGNRSAGYFNAKIEILNYN